MEVGESGKWGKRGREVGVRGREVGNAYPTVHPLTTDNCDFVTKNKQTRNVSV